MRYISTRGCTEPQSFTDAVITGLAPDGGLLLPECLPDFSSEIPRWRSLGFIELAKELLPHFVDDIPQADLARLIQQAYESFDHPDVVALRELGDVHVLELFHGPTLAFKDVALQLLGQLFEYILERQGTHLNILGATSGDTGSAAIAGVRGLPAVDIFIMFPEGRVSRLQELQMTTVADANVHCLAVKGSFDDCQTMMKRIFGDLEFKARYSLGAVNSVNWARVLAQIVYYAFASIKLGGDTPATFCVPTGNFGNVFAGYLAKRMGFPIDKLIVATNENDILSQFFETGVYQRGEVRYTISPAMDIQVASNFERYLYYHLDCDERRLSAFMEEFAETGRAALPKPPSSEDFLATTVNVRETSAEIAATHRSYDYLIDPHTAVGMAAASRFEVPGAKICLATAHPAKFPEAVNRAVGADVARHASLQALEGLTTRRTVLQADVEAVTEFIRSNAASR